MFLLVTLSICFAVNRHNHFDDFIFLLALVVHPYSVIILMFVILPAWAIWMKVSPGRDPSFTCRPIPNGGRQVFFRFSTRQSMFLLVTLSICFAVNRHNHFDDFIFLLALVVHPYSVIILMFVILPAWAIWMKVRPGRDPSFSCRPIPNGRVWGGSFASREVAIIELLKSISRVVSEQCPWRRARVEGKTFPADDNKLQKSSAHATATRPKQYR